MNVPRVVVATRPTALQRVVARHGTAGQARFFLSSRGSSLDDLQRWQAEQDAAVAAVEAAVPIEWRRAYVRRGEIRSVSLRARRHRRRGRPGRSRRERREVPRGAAGDRSQPESRVVRRRPRAARARRGP